MDFKTGQIVMLVLKGGRFNTWIAVLRKVQGSLPDTFAKLLTVTQGLAEDSETHREFEKTG